MRTHPLDVRLLLALSLSVAACSAPTPAAVDAGADAPADAPADASSVCAPSRAEWNATVLPLVTQHCGNCHGPTPSYGSPYSLTDYDALLRATSAGRPVDHIARQLIEGAMPPSGSPAMPLEARRALAAWASCGASVPTATPALQASRPVFQSPDRPLAGLATFDLRAQRHPVGPDVTDQYQCFAFDAPVTEPRFIRRMEALVDQGRVVHHIVLLRDPDRSTAATPSFACSGMPASSQYLYAWAPGQNSFEFPQGGLRVAPGQRFILQIHYNNGSRVPDVVDSSGVRLFHDAPGGTEYGMVAIGPQGFSIAPRSAGHAESNCTLRANTTILAGMPHMHEVGTTFSQTVIHADGTREPLINLTGWRFDSQLFYDLGRTLRTGDKLLTRCEYNNLTASPVRSGNGTRDEMCFGFTYVTPPPALSYCDEGTIDVERVPYSPGSCAPADAPTDLSLVDVRVQVADAPAATGGVVPSGRWTLTGLEMYLTGLATGLGDLDLAQTRVRARGQAWVRDGRFTLDSVAGLHLVTTTGVTYDRGLPVAFSGPFAATTTSPLTVRSDCGIGGDIPLAYSVTGDELAVASPPQGLGSLRLTARYIFRRAP